MIEVFYYDGKVKKGSLSDFNMLKDKSFWVDLTDITDEEKEFVQKAFNLHQLTAEDLLNQNTRIKVEEFSDYLFCVFYGIRKEKSFEMVEIDFILGKNFLVTCHKNPFNSCDKLKNDEERLCTLFKKGNDFIFHKIIDEEIDNYFPVLEKIDYLVEDIEEEATLRPNSKLLGRILNLKRQIVLIKKTTLPQREKLSFLSKTDFKFVSKKSLPYFRDVYDNSIKVSDSIDNYREAVGNAFEAYMSSVSNNMSEVMKVLSIMATIALPLTVISGIYGTNFLVLPGSDDPYGFWLMLLGMLILISLMLFYFKKRKWF